jgi:hypothetical protein
MQFEEFLKRFCRWRLPEVELFGNPSESICALMQHSFFCCVLSKTSSSFFPLSAVTTMGVSENTKFMAPQHMRAF